ncbi:T9SS type A sorting domain-containing protein [Candidatus Poribacteria bacterium]|nr:T9SS type A sorting domain-containing protein [Candidatus Poribacteria bacterium]
MKRSIALLPLLMTVALCTSSDAEFTHQFLFGHKNRVLAVAFSPDGKWLASGGGGRYEIRIWDVATSKQIYTLTGHTAQIKDLAFRNNGDLASASEDGTVRLWDVPAQGEIRRFNGHVGAAVTSVAFSPDGKRLVSGSSDRTLKLWEADTGKLLKTFEGHKDVVWSVAFSPTREVIASGSEDRTVRLWNALDGSLLQTFTGHTERVWSVAFHPSGAQIASGSWDGTVRVWNVEQNAPLPLPIQLPIPQKPFATYDREVLSVSFSPDGRLLAIGLVDKGNDNTLKLWEVATARELRSFDTKAKQDVAFSPDGLRFAVAGAADGTVTIWNSSRQKPALIEPQANAHLKTRQVTLKWEDVADSVYYDVEIARDANFVPRTQFVTVTTNAFTFETGDVPGYWWRVRTGGFGKVGDWSDPSSFLTPYLPPPTCVVRITPPRQRVSLGDEFSIEVVIDSVVDLAGFQFDLQWTNPGVLTFVTVTKFRNIFGESGIGQKPVEPADQENGLYKNVIATQKGPGGVSGSGTLLGVLFRARNTGSSQIQLNNLTLVNSKQERIPCNVFKSTMVVENPARPYDINGDGVVDVFDLSIVAKYFGQKITIDLGFNPDVNNDGVVDILDFTTVGSHFGESYQKVKPKAVAAPSIEEGSRAGSLPVQKLEGAFYATRNTQYAIPTKTFERIYAELLSMPDNSPAVVRTRQVLRYLLSSVNPSRSALLQNYPNPFNPETWIPFQLAAPSNVTIEIRDVTGKLVRQLLLGYLSPGHYTNREDAAYWDGRNRQGEPVASGVYFYTLSTESFSDTRKMIIAK